MSMHMPVHMPTQLSVADLLTLSPVPVATAAPSAEAEENGWTAEPHGRWVTPPSSERKEKEAVERGLWGCYDDSAQ